MATANNPQSTPATRNPGRNPGDEAAPGTEQTGEISCPVCHGSGKTASATAPCANCGGTGMVVVTVGDA